LLPNEALTIIRQWVSCFPLWERLSHFMSRRSGIWLRRAHPALRDSVRLIQMADPQLLLLHLRQNCNDPCTRTTNFATLRPSTDDVDGQSAHPQVFEMVHRDKFLVPRQIIPPDILHRLADRSGSLERHSSDSNR
jgi:hypothetical protein